MWIVALPVLALVAWLLYRAVAKRPDIGQSGFSHEPGPQPIRLAVSVQYSTPDPEEWARERERRQRLREDGIARLRAAFVPPANFEAARAGIDATLRDFAEALGVTPPDVRRLEEDARATEPLKKREALTASGSTTPTSKGSIARSWSSRSPGA